ncbi:MAG: replication initiator protein A, partial [Fusobacteriaceae bacterium]
NSEIFLILLSIIKYFIFNLSITTSYFYYNNTIFLYRNKLFVYYNIHYLLVSGKITPSAYSTYILMYDRLRLSIENNWFDKNGYAYIRYSYDEMEKHLKTSRTQIKRNLVHLQFFIYRCALRIIFQLIHKLVLVTKKLLKTMSKKNIEIYLKNLYLALKDNPQVLNVNNVFVEKLKKGERQINILSKNNSISKTPAISVSLTEKKKILKSKN